MTILFYLHDCVEKLKARNDERRKVFQDFLLESNKRCQKEALRANNSAEYQMLLKEHQRLIEEEERRNQDHKLLLEYHERLLKEL